MDAARSPYKEIEGTDLVATFHLHTNNEKDSTEGILVVNGLLEQWGQDVDSLYREALQNMQHQMPVQIKNLNDFLLSGEANQKPEQVSCNPVELYVMTNAKGEYGAATLLYPEVLQTLAENSNGDLFILPSSIHEVLVMKADGGFVPHTSNLCPAFSKSPRCPRLLLASPPKSYTTVSFYCWIEFYRMDFPQA